MNGGWMLMMALPGGWRPGVGGGRVVWCVGWGQGALDRQSWG